MNFCFFFQNTLNSFFFWFQIDENIYYCFKVFPDLRLWCEARKLRLVECDLRWVIIINCYVICKYEMRYGDWCWKWIWRPRFKSLHWPYLPMLTLGKSANNTVYLWELAHHIFYKLIDKNKKLMHKLAPHHPFNSRIIYIVLWNSFFCFLKKRFFL